MRQPAERWFGTEELAERVGASPRQLQWWSEHKIVTPQMEHRVRRYGWSEAVAAGIAAELRRRNMSLQAVRRVLQAWRRQSLNGGGPAYLVTNGRRTMATREAADAIREMARTSRGVFLVDVGEIAKKLAQTD